MKQKITLFVVLAILFSQTLFAQIPNPSLETWAGSTPTYWSFPANDSATSLITASQTTDAQLGAKAVKLEVMSVSTVGIGGILLSNTFPQTTFPPALHFWAKCTLVGGDVISASESITDAAGAVSSIAYTTVSTNSSVYQEIVAPFNAPSGTADSSTIVIQLYGAPYPHAGTVAYIDNLFFGSVIGGVEENQGGDFMLESITPNPSNQLSAVIYKLAVPAEVTLAIYDVCGKKVKEVVNENQHPGRFKAYIETTEFAKGIYFCQLNVNGVIQTKKLVVN